MIIVHPLVDGDVKEICPLIFCVAIKDNYDRAMFFSRYSEFYESPYNDIKGKNISFEHFMKLYRKKRKDESFEYHKHWIGFNIPSDIIKKALNTFTHKTEYDTIMNDIINYCDSIVKRDYPQDSKYYVIGVQKFKGEVTRHEIAHGLYYLNKNYKKEVDLLIEDITKSDFNFLKNKLLKLGYDNSEEIIFDEIQAILTGPLDESFKKPNIIKYGKKFKKVFKEYYIDFKY